MRIWYVAATLLAAVGAGWPTSALANVDPYDGDWHFSLTPYAWLPGIDTSLKFQGPRGSIARTSLNTSPGDIIDHLHIAAMIAGDVHKGEWSAFSDIVYASLGGSNTAVRDITFPDHSIEIPLNLRTSVGVQVLVWTAGIGYAVLHDGQSSADVFLGVRGAGANTSLKWRFAGPLDLFPQTGSTSQYESLWDGIIGIRGRIGFPESPWFVPYYADIGTGGSHITAQALTGIGYGFEWGDLHLTYRWLYYQPGGDGVLDKITLHGFTIGATFRF
jgi:hypothetical protein